MALNLPSWSKFKRGCSGEVWRALAAGAGAGHRLDTSSVPHGPGFALHARIPQPSKAPHVSAGRKEALPKEKHLQQICAFRTLTALL